MSWERYLAFRDAFAGAMDGRFYCIEYLDWLMREGRAQAFFTDRSAVIAEIKTYPTGARVASFLIAAGDQDELVNELAPQVEAWGRANGCTLALIESRPGWARVMKDHGYETFQVSIVKEI